MFPFASVVGSFLSSPPADLLRLLAVPAFGWAAYRDVRTRRVPNETWAPLALLGVALLAWEVWTVWSGGTPYRQRLLVVRLAVSLGLVAPLGYVFWRLGGFGGADAKAVMVLALLFPTYPTYYLPGAVLPLYAATLGVFSLTVLSNTVLLGAGYPLLLAARNALAGRFAPVMFVGRPVDVGSLTGEYGRLLETTDGFTRRGLDLDALRMYLTWRGATLAEVRADPERFRDPASLPPEDERDDPGDGSLAESSPAVTDGGERSDGPRTPMDERSESTGSEPSEARRAPSDSWSDGERVNWGELAPAVRRVDATDEWGAEAFLAETDAYGTSPEQLREGLEVLVTEDEVWMTPGIPFVVPMFVGLVVALTFGDLLFAAMGALGLI